MDNGTAFVPPALSVSIVLMGMPSFTMIAASPDDFRASVLPPPFRPLMM